MFEDIRWSEDRLDDSDVLGRRLVRSGVEVARHLAVAGSMAVVATVSALVVEKVGTGSVTCGITHVVLVEVRTAKVEAHLAERHLVIKVNVFENKLIVKLNKKNIHNQFFFYLTKTNEN